MRTPHSENGDRRDGEVRQTATGFVVTEQLLERWKTTFPAVDIAHELRRAYEWMVADPRRQKIRLQRFLYNWMARRQDQPGRLPEKTLQEQAHDIAKQVTDGRGRIW